MKRVGVSLLPPWVGMPILRKAAPLFQPPPPRVFYQATLRIRWYPFILLVGERHCENNLSCPRIQEYSPMTRSGLEPRPFDAEFSALTVRLTVIETWKRGRYLSELIKVLYIFFTWIHYLQLLVNAIPNPRRAVKAFYPMDGQKDPASPWHTYRKNSQYLDTKSSQVVKIRNPTIVIWWKVRINVGLGWEG